MPICSQPGGIERDPRFGQDPRAAAVAVSSEQCEPVAVMLFSMWHKLLSRATDGVRRLLLLSLLHFWTNYVRQRRREKQRVAFWGIDEFMVQL